MANPNPIFDTPTKNIHGKLLLSIMDKKKIVLIVEATSREVVSVYWIDCIQSIINGFFVIVVAIIVAIVAVCCIADVFVNVNEVDAKEKTPFKQWQQTQDKDTKRTQTGCIRHWLVRLDINEEQMLKHTSTNNVPSNQEEQLTFLLSKYQASDIKTAFADAIGKVGKAARKAFYPLQFRKEKLISNFLELIYDGKSIMVDNSKDSFR